jgi:hypothetical protein
MGGLPAFDRYIGIDYSGAQTPISSLKGLRIYMADRNGPPNEVPPPPSPRKYWTRREIAEWLVERLSEEQATLVGIDHGFSFPLRYFDKYHLPHDWPAFLDDFQRHWPTDDPHLYVDFIRDGHYGKGAARCGNTRWRRITEERAGAKSVFHFDVPGSVAKSTHAELPWLRYRTPPLMFCFMSKVSDTPSPEAVRGMSCISPQAPLIETARSFQFDSCWMIACINSRGTW